MTTSLCAVSARCSPALAALPLLALLAPHPARAEASPCGGIGAGVGISIDLRCTLSATPPALVVTAYAASGAIAPTDDLSLLACTGACTMTLALSTADLHRITLKNVGPGTVTLDAAIDGNAQSFTLNPPGGTAASPFGDSLTLQQSNARATWLAE